MSEKRLSSSGNSGIMGRWIEAEFLPETGNGLLSVYLMGMVVQA